MAAVVPASLAGDLLRFERAQRHGNTDVAAYGDLAWTAVLNEEDRALFVEELKAVLLVAIAGGPVEKVFEVTEDWRVTAAAWSDDELRDELLADNGHPLTDVEL